MTRQFVGALIMGLAGAAVLLALGFWQLQRLEWKQDVLTEIEARIANEPGPLPMTRDPQADRFRPVELRGRIGSAALRVVATDDGGPAYRIVSPFDTEGRTVLLDRGVVPVDAPVPEPPAGELTVRGNVHWPDEGDSFTPPPELDEGLWYARDVAGMSEVLGTEPLLVVAREVPGDAVSPRPIDTATIPNDHLEYAVTWFSLAAVWAGMTAVLVWRIRRRIG